jgi:hypothetical protein
MLRIVLLTLAVISLQACSLPQKNNPSTGPNQSVLFRKLPKTEGYVFARLPSGRVARVAVAGGHAVYQGDILIAPVSKAQLSSQSAVISSPYNKWPSGVVTYDIAPHISATVRSQISQAIRDFEAKTKIRFVSRWLIYPGASFDNYVYITSSPSYPCASYIGRIGGKQDLYLSNDGACGLNGTIHELGHAVGLYHEQSRKDRDAYIEVLYNNIEPAQRYNFDIDPNSTAVAGYSYVSVMHYNAYGFSINGRPTIRPRDRSIPLDRLGSSRLLSSNDVKGINALYP